MVENQQGGGEFISAEALYGDMVVVKEVANSTNQAKHTYAGSGSAHPPC